MQAIGVAEDYNFVIIVSVLGGCGKMIMCFLMTEDSMRAQASMVSITLLLFSAAVMAAVLPEAAGADGDKPAVQYRSIFEGYQRQQDVAPGDWRELNDKAQGGGHAGHHMHGADDAPAANTDHSNH